MGWLILGRWLAETKYYDGMFRQAGIIRARTTEDLFDWSLALSTQPELKGRKIGILTDSGGTGTCMARLCLASRSGGSPVWERGTERVARSRFG